MVRNPLQFDDTLEIDEVIGVLGDSDSKTIINTLHRPMTANEIAEICDIPLSTTYRKLERLTESSLLEEQTAIRSDGHHTSQYRRNFDEVVISVDDSGSLQIEIERPARTADERLAHMWSEVKREV